MRVLAEDVFRRVRSRRFLKFGTIGASGIIVNLAVLVFSREVLFSRVASSALRLNLALGVAIFCATLSNFTWNRRWTWAEHRGGMTGTWLSQFGRYALACWISIALQAIITNVLAARASYVLANLTAIGLTTIVNFVANDVWTFRAR